MPRDFESVLDRHLNALMSGSQPRVTEYASGSAEGLELAGLLDVAQRVRAVPLPAPSPQAVAAGRMRLMQAVQARAEDKAARLAKRERWLAWLRPALAGSVAATMAVVAIVSVYAISAKSLPGSPLYTVKWASEQVRLALAASPVQRAQVHITLAERRLQEVQRMAQMDNRDAAATLDAMNRETEAALGALLEVPSVQAAPLFGDVASLARRQEAALLWMQSNSTPDEQPAVAQAVVAAHDNRQAAAAASADPQSASSRIEAPTNVVAVVDFRGPVVASSPDTLSVGSRNVALASTTLVSGNPATGTMVEVQAAESSDGQLLALSVRETVPSVSTIKIEGRVTGAYDSTWLINGRQVVFDAYTTIVGWIATGVDVQVEAIVRSDGKLLARTAQRWVKTSDPELSIEGPLASHSGQKWIVGGCFVIVDSRTYIDESQALVGTAAGAKVKASRAADGTLVARSVVLLDAKPAAAFTIRGPLASREGTQWRIGDFLIESDSLTVVSGQSGAGKAAQAEILATLTADGKLVATRVVLGTETAVGAVDVEFDGLLEWNDRGPTVAGRSFQLSDAAVVRSGTRTVELKQVSAGRTVLVRGQMLADGAILAGEVSILRRGTSIEISGTIERTEKGLLVVNGREVVVDSAVDVIGPDGIVSADQLATGQSVTIVGQTLKDESLLAWVITLPGAKSRQEQTVTTLPAAAPAASPTALPSGNGKPKSGPLPTGTVLPTQAITATATATATTAPITPTQTVTPADVTATPTATIPSITPTPTGEVTPTVDANTPSPTVTPTPTASAGPLEPTYTPSAPAPSATPTEDDTAVPTPTATSTAEDVPGGSVPPSATPTPTDAPTDVLPPAATPTPGDAPGCAVPPSAAPTAGDAPGSEPPPSASPASGDAPGASAPPTASPAAEPVAAPATKQASSGRPGPGQAIRLAEGQATIP